MKAEERVDLWEVETFGLEGQQIPLEEFTCYYCMWWTKEANECEFAFDLYNRPIGDCLAEK